MSSRVSSKSSPIVIVGAGVFGLSTAIHLAQRGYTNVKVLDKQTYHETEYSYDRGCDAASAGMIPHTSTVSTGTSLTAVDINKIIRMAYGSQIEYQTLALDALARWKEWNKEIKTGAALPPGFTADDALFVNNGNLTMFSDSSLPEFETNTMRNMAKAGLEKSQIVLTNQTDVARAEANGFGFAVNPFKRQNNYGILDIQGSFAYADKACRFALYKAQALGVQFIFGPERGMFSSFLRDGESRIKGVRAADGTSHSAELTVMACGGWTPSLITQLDNLCETTAGSVCTFQLPRGSAVWDHFAPENFPTWTYDIRHGASGGLYGFARDANGVVKIGYRGTKFTNPQPQADGVSRSIPITRWTAKSTRQMPLLAARTIRGFVEAHMPELLSCETKTRLCWYTDSFDNHFVIDFVPNVDGLMAATGGSGHGFKFLPNLGSHVVDRIEGRPSDYLQLWRWRSLGRDQKPYNVIMEGESSEWSLGNQDLTADDSLLKHRARI